MNLSRLAGQLIDDNLAKLICCGKMDFAMNVIKILLLVLVRCCQCGPTLVFPTSFFI